MDEFDALTLPDEQIRAMIGIEFDELVLDEPDVREIISRDIICSFLKALSCEGRPSWIKSSYDEKVHELYRSIRQRQRD